MKVDRVCVRRLKTFEYYGNASVELCATLDENDRLDDVVSWLQIKAEAYVEKQKEVTKLEEYTKTVEQLVSDVKKLQKELEEAKDNLEKKWDELSELIDELRYADEDVARVKGIIERIKEKLAKG